MTETRVPLLDLNAQYAPIRDEILAAMTRVADSQRFIMGPEIDALEAELAQTLGARHAIAVSSGTDALLLALMAVGIGPGDEVVTSDYSFFATAGAVDRVGATPVFVDIDPATFNVDVEAVGRAVTERTKAIVPVHLFGLAADVDPLIRLAIARRIPLIEDAAQAIGATYRGRTVGTIGAFGCFSFFPSKNLGAFGDAGLLTTNDEDLCERARLLRTHGMKPRYIHHAVGGNFRMDALQAAVLRVKLKYLDGWTERRRTNAARYVQLFRHAGLADRVRLPIEPAGMRHIYNQFVIRMSARDSLRRHLADRGIGTEIYYPVPFHRQPCFAELSDAARAFPHSDDASATSLAIPIYAELTEAQQSLVVESIAEHLNRTSAAAVC